MILTIDIGNTNMEFGIYHQDVLKTNFRLVTNPNITSDEIGLFVSEFFRVHRMPVEDIEDVVIASVVPQVMFSVQNAMIKYLKKKPIIIGENIMVPMKVECYDSVGADCLVSGYAAFLKYQGPLVVIDFGTATTFSVISKEGVYQGGTIFPGIKISMEALYQHTAKLPMVELSEPNCAIGKDTVTSMQAGAIFGFVGATVYMVERLKEEMGGDAYVVATGGLSSYIQNRTDIIDRVDKTLTLDGLYYTYTSQKDS